MQNDFYEEPTNDNGFWELFPKGWDTKGGCDDFFAANPKVRYPFLYAKAKEFLLQMRDAVYGHDARLTVKEWNEYFRAEGLAVESPWLDD